MTDRQAAASTPPSHALAGRRTAERVKRELAAGHPVPFMQPACRPARTVRTVRPQEKCRAENHPPPRLSIRAGVVAQSMIPAGYYVSSRQRTIQPLGLSGASQIANPREDTADASRPSYAGDMLLS